MPSERHGRKILILTALPIEAGAILRSLPPGRSPDALDVRCIGLRAANILQAVPLQKLSEDPPLTILMVGVAGGLDPTLRVGDIVIDAEDNCPEVADARFGRIHTADQVVCRSIDKASLFQQTGALAIDMEQEIVRRICNELGIEVIGIRAISDPADLSLPDQIANWVDTAGKPRPRQIAMDLARHPTLIAKMLRLHKNMGRALKALSEAVAQVVVSLENPPVS